MMFIIDKIELEKAKMRNVRITNTNRKVGDLLYSMENVKMKKIKNIRNVRGKWTITKRGRARRLVFFKSQERVKYMSISYIVYHVLHLSLPC